jgi:hypothetical protein
LFGVWVWVRVCVCVWGVCVLGDPRE